jgi:uncharacterized protein YacL
LNNMNKKQEETATAAISKLPSLPQRFIVLLAEEIAKTMVLRMPGLHIATAGRKKVKKKVKTKQILNPIFLDTSAIIDGRIFDLIQLGLLTGTFVITDSILRELKHIADSQDAVRRERGRRGLDKLARIRKNRGVKIMVLKEDYESNSGKPGEIDERIIKAAKEQKGKIITCDYNLNKKANIDGVNAINLNELANILKVIAVPGEALHVRVQHAGKEETQGVGYLDDGTMIVVEQGRDALGQAVDVVVSRVIQTASGRILFAKQL